MPGNGKEGEIYFYPRPVLGVSMAECRPRLDLPTAMSGKSEGGTRGWGNLRFRSPPFTFGSSLVQVKQYIHAMDVIFIVHIEVNPSNV